MKSERYTKSSNLATPTNENRLGGTSKAVFLDFSPAENKNGSKKAVTFARYFDKNIRMSDNPKAIPIHPSPPRFVDSKTQPLVIYYIWNIDTQSFVRKRNLIPKNVPKNKIQHYANELIKAITADINKGFVAFNKKETATKFIKENQEANRISNKDFTLKEAFDNFIARKAMSLSPSSTKAYKGYLKWFLAFCEKHNFTNLPIKDFTTQQANIFFDEIYLTTSIGAKTHNEIVSFVKSVFGYYHKKKVIKENPCVYELKIVESEESHYPFTLDQIKLMKTHILEVLNDEQLWLFVNFCFYTFARPRIEIRLLKVKDILASTIYISAQHAKKNKSRHVIISEQLERLITKHQLRSYPQDFYIFSAGGTPGPKPTGLNYFYKKFKKVLVACDLTDKDYGLYGLKHTGNIQAKISGTSVYDLQKQNGHESIQQTENYLRKIGAISTTDQWKLKQPTI